VKWSLENIVFKVILRKMQLIWVRHFDCEKFQEKKKKIQDKRKVRGLTIFLHLESDFQKINVPCKKLKKSKL
jgi:hypothetical protein